MNLIAGLIATIMQFLKINELMENHRTAALGHGNLSRTSAYSLHFHERNVRRKAYNSSKNVSRRMIVFLSSHHLYRNIS
jgi:hypothetical protein